MGHDIGKKAYVMPLYLCGILKMQKEDKEDKNDMRWIRQFMIIALITFIGEVLRYFVPLAIPAGVYGLVLLFTALCSGVVKLPQVEEAADFLIEIMPLFFIPAGVGLMTKWTELKSMLIPFLLAVFVITVLVMIVTGRVSQWLIRRKESENI